MLPTDSLVTVLALCLKYVELCCKDRPYHALGMHRSALSTHSLPPQPPLLQFRCQTRALISLRPRCSARANGLSLDSFHNSPHPSYRGHSHKGRVALHRPHHPHSSASRHRGQTGLDGVEGFIGFQLTQPVRPLCSLSSTFYVSLFLPSNATASFTLLIPYPHSHKT